MTRAEDSKWAVNVLSISGRPGQSLELDADFPAPSGIGDQIIGVSEGDAVHVAGNLDSIVDGLILTGRITAPVHAECTRCLKPLSKDWDVDTTAFFAFDAKDQNPSGSADADADIIAGEDESEDVYPVEAGGAIIDLEALLRDNLVESMPLQPVCKEDCLGLCPQCGINLNDNPEHTHEISDIRWAALEDFKAKLDASQKER
ncbi:YceD family protein [Bifidobacterium crudilactis]|jgi:uncharacterized protein|uniref:YceD family protein n=1 Tax=Bifidobacterium crudilactis TaxID=327277 RepID=UPI00054E088E|nr:DUF177 domain-containing protein [Bifidobacterium crudilactis]MCI1637435.1 DUF177 domain-containing protein [Bifidobacterium crudilactis]MCI2148533.1 DUF177 domain-containing protein [Bifidobacterium crudilactis]MCI2157045.1 DUF177 domain-containing protein [Bifidobacterium crudilactis]